MADTSAANEAGSPGHTSLDGRTRRPFGTDADAAFAEAEAAWAAFADMPRTVMDLTEGPCP